MASSVASPSARSRERARRKRFVERIPAKMTVGPTVSMRHDMGPLISAEHRGPGRRRISSGAAMDGAPRRRRRTSGLARPIEGRILPGSPRRSIASHPGMAWDDDEIFGPVLSVVRVEWVRGRRRRPINANPWANGTALFTARRRCGAPSSSTTSRWGWWGSTCPFPLPVSYYSFGGWKASLFGDTQMYGPEGINFYTRGKVVTSPLAYPATTIDSRLPRNPVAARGRALSGSARAPATYSNAVDALNLARSQFGITTVYDFLMVPLTIGLWMTVAGTRYPVVPQRRRGLPPPHQVLREAVPDQFRHGRRHRHRPRSSSSA